MHNSPQEDGDGLAMS